MSKTETNRSGQLTDAREAGDIPWAIVERLDRTAWNLYVEGERVELDSIGRAARAWRRLAVEPA